MRAIGPVVLLIVWFGLGARTAEAQPCPGTPPCGHCVEDVATATCKPRPVRVRTVEVTSTPPGATIWVSVNDKPATKKGVTGRRPKKLVFRPSDRVTLELQLPGHLAWRGTLTEDERTVHAELDLRGTLLVSAEADPALHGATQRVECRATGGGWSACGVVEPRCCGRELVFRAGRAGRLVIEREGYRSHVVEWPAGVTRPRIDPPRLVATRAIHETFDGGLGARFQANGGFTTEAGAARSLLSTAHPLWTAHGLPAEGVIDLDVWSKSQGPVTVLTWADPGILDHGLHYRLVHGGWGNSKSVLVRVGTRGATVHQVDRPASVTPGQRTRMRIVRKGATVSWYVDDLMTPFLAFADPSPPDARSPRHLGLGGENPDVRFDSLTITPLALAGGRVRIESNTPATVRDAGGSVLGATPWEGDRPAGRLELVLSASGFVDRSVVVEVRPGETHRATATLDRVPKGVLALGVTPSAAVWITGPGTDMTRWVEGTDRLELSPGEYHLEVSADGYEPARASVSIIGGQTVDRSFALVRTPQPEVTIAPPPLTTGSHEQWGAPAAEPAPSVEPLDPMVVDARARYLVALSARDDITHRKVLRGMGIAALSTCMAGGIGVNIWGAASDGSLGLRLGAIMVGGAAGFGCYMMLLGSRRWSDLRWRVAEADTAVAQARAELVSAMDTYGERGRRRALLARPRGPRLGFGVTIADGLELGPSTEHAGVALEAGLHVNARWLHPEVALETDPGDGIVVLRPGLRLSLGRWAFVRGALELDLVGGDGETGVFGGAGFNLWLSSRVAWELAADYTQSMAEVDPVSAVRARIGIRYGL